MVEPWRSRYLHALGVDVYLPRVILPAAKPSIVCEWDWPVQEDAVQSSPEATAPDMAAVDPRPMANTNAPVTAESPANVRPIPVIEERTARREPIAVAERPKERSTIPQFALSVIATDAGVLVVDDAPVKSSARGEYLRLISNIAFALQGGAHSGAPALDVFIWPMIKNNSQIDQSAGAAREALAAYVQKQIHNRALRTVLLLGENAQQWLTESARPQLGAACAVSPISGWRCLADPTVKRQLWHDIRHLAVSAQ